MRQVCSGRSAARRAIFSLLCLALFALLLASSPLPAQTQQPYLFATAQVNSSPAVGVFTRNDATGALSEVAGSPFPLLTPNCYPATMEPKARYLLGPCGDGISLYQFNSATGVVSEVPNSPFAASTGGPPDAVIAESTGQFAYALRITRTAYSTPSTATLDSFTIDAANNVLNQPSTQTFELSGTFLGLIVDPNGHFLQILLSTSGGGSFPLGGSCALFFDPQSGLPITSSAGLCQSGVTAGTNPVGIAVDARGTFIGTGSDGEIFPSISVFAISPATGTLQASGVFLFSDASDHIVPPFFDPLGQLVYVSSQDTGVRIFSLSVSSGSVSFTELPSSPLPSNIDATPLSALADPAAEFTYIGGSNVITTYPIDSTTGYPGTPIPNTLNHTPPLNYQPVFATMPPPGQAVSAPAISLSASSLSFGPVNPGQTSGPQIVTVSSTGNEALTLSSIAISPVGGPFSETDTCMSSPVLAAGTSCQISILYSPASVGVTQASLAITDNAAGSPQIVSLSGTTVAPPPPAPEVTLVPGTLSFPGTTAQGESSAPQIITITNSGSATLNFTAAAALSGVNTADFSISANTCGSSLAASASCTLSVIFSPQAAGVRTTSLLLADSASNSPQSVTINGNSVAAATFTTQSGSSATVSAGQPATFNLQANPGAGFSGTLAFSCVGAPTAATCSAPSVTLASGASTSFSVTVTTSGTSFLAPRLLPRFRWTNSNWVAVTLLAIALLALLAIPRSRPLPGWRQLTPLALRSALIALVLAGCGGSGSSSLPQQAVTPSGTYTLTITPTATPSGSARNFTLNPITLTLTVN
jgi:hypothetical protein